MRAFVSSEAGGEPAAAGGGAAPGPCAWTVDNSSSAATQRNLLKVSLILSIRVERRTEHKLGHKRTNHGSLHFKFKPMPVIFTVRSLVRPFEERIPYD
jgi:hypothetical protein